MLSYVKSRWYLRRYVLFLLLLLNVFFKLYDWEQPEIHMPKNEFIHRPYTSQSLFKMNHRPKWKTKTIKILEGNIGETLGDLVLNNDFLDVTLTAWPMKERIDKPGFIIIRNFCSEKDTVKRMARQSTDSGTIFAKDVSEKNQISTIGKQTTWLKNGSKTLTDFTKEDIEMAKKYVKKILHIIGHPENANWKKWWATTTYPVERLNSRSLTTPGWQGCGAIETHSLLLEHKIAQPVWKSVCDQKMWDSWVSRETS